MALLVSRRPEPHHKTTRGVQKISNFKITSTNRSHLENTQTHRLWAIPYISTGHCSIYTETVTDFRSAQELYIMVVDKDPTSLAGTQSCSRYISPRGGQSDIPEMTGGELWATAQPGEHPEQEAEAPGTIPSTITTLEWVTANFLGLLFLLCSICITARLLMWEVSKSVYGISHKL